MTLVALGMCSRRSTSVSLPWHPVTASCSAKYAFSRSLLLFLICVESDMLHQFHEDWKNCHFENQSNRKLPPSMFLCCMGVQVPSATYSTARHTRITRSDNNVGNSSIAFFVHNSLVHMFRHRIPENDCLTAPPASDPPLLRLTLSRARARGFIMITTSRRRPIPVDCVERRLGWGIGTGIGGTSSRRRNRNLPESREKEIITDGARRKPVESEARAPRESLRIALHPNKDGKIPHSDGFLSLGPSNGTIYSLLN